MKLRPATPADAPALAAIFVESILTLGRRAYDERQVEAWAAWGRDVSAFAARIPRGFSLVAEAAPSSSTVAAPATASADHAPAALPIAFAQLDPVDHVDFLYCHPAHARRGVATALYEAMEAHARAHGVGELTSDASHLSRPFFERHGWRVLTPERIVRRGVELERFKMAKKLA